MAIAGFTRKILADETIELYAGGESSRDYTFVLDIVSGIRGVIRHPRPFEIYNIGNAAVVSLRELVQALETVLGRKANVTLAPAQPGDVQQTYSDISKARRLLEYSPHTSIEQGLRQYFDWLETVGAGSLADK